MVYEKIPREIRLNACILRRKRVKLPQIASSLEISQSTIYRAIANSKKHGDINRIQQKHSPSAFIPPGISEVFRFILLSIS